MANDASLAFLDAAVLASPVTRTLLTAGSDPTGVAITWSCCPTLWMTMMASLVVGL